MQKDEHGCDSSSLTAVSKAVGEQLCLDPETVLRWVIQAETDAGDLLRTTSEEAVKIRRLKAENWRLREDSEILRKAPTICGAARPTPPLIMGFIDPKRHPGRVDLQILLAASEHRPHRRHPPMLDSEKPRMSLGADTLTHPISDKPPMRPLLTSAARRGRRLLRAKTLS